MHVVQASERAEQPSDRNKLIHQESCPAQVVNLPHTTEGMR